ncbi:flagellar biosynthesis/type III secretory pathway chaperone [Gracilibacillus halotolerans]|uniref:Flagellar biosynthesis/type III secretory pathway chaperone n=1 Tax=Gracilibacillus halotolerans TaxID=74386 RepID=A0A841RHZ5_9BACI|nr:flagellar protein FlgN [Gracilibacillus halotolerans]MBB6512281.1 flagellar biosynthesis/type III secretory pathway chaperone [Gracilibacillus halotolerans]
MTVQTIITLLNQLVELHKRLLAVSKEKTDILKEGDFDSLQELLKKEQALVKNITQVEQKRMKELERWSMDKGLNFEEITVTTLIETYIEGSEKDDLEKVTLELANILHELRSQEDLNKQLTEQSMQFVQLSLNMMAPRPMNNMNYGNKPQQPPSTYKQSIFDSKA